MCLRRALLARARWGARPAMVRTCPRGAKAGCGRMAPWKTVRWGMVWLACFAWLASSVRAESGRAAPTAREVATLTQTGPTALQTRVRRMDRTLRLLSTERNGSELTCLSGTLTGGITGAFWLSATLSDDSHRGTRAQALLGAASLVAAGTALVHSALCWLVANRIDAERLQRWERVGGAGPIDAVTLAGFEGELRADSRTARLVRLARGAAAVGRGLAGLTLAALAVSPVLEGNAEKSAYLLGGLYIALSTWETIAAFGSVTPHERAFRQYEAGCRRPASESDEHRSGEPVTSARMRGLRWVSHF